MAEKKNEFENTKVTLVHCLKPGCIGHKKPDGEHWHLERDYGEPKKYLEANKKMSPAFGSKRAARALFDGFYKGTDEEKETKKRMLEPKLLAALSDEVPDSTEGDIDFENDCMHAIRFNKGETSDIFPPSIHREVEKLFGPPKSKPN